MDMELELFKQNPWWDSKYETDFFPRENYLNLLKKNLKNKEIIFLTGLRRIGKTTIMKQLIHDLLQNNVNPEDILFLTLDSIALTDFTIHEIIKEYRKLHKKSIKSFFYLFLDEVTAKENFEQELKNIYDLENIKIFCSSSIASYMRDKKAFLTGRTKTIEVMPLTFQEFLIFRKVKIRKLDRYLFQSYFKDYLKIGGIPYYVITEDREYLNELIESVIYKDIIAYHNIKNEKVIKELFVLLCERVGKMISYNKLSRILSLSVDSIKRYVSYFEKTYLFYIMDKYTKSFNEGITSPKKVYIGDVGIKNLITGFRDLGASYENLVFLKIKDQLPRYYTEALTEIDFITKDSIIEAKYNNELNSKQLKIFNSINKKNKIVAQGVEFFL